MAPAKVEVIAEFQQVWLDSAMYGGKFLVGARWVVSAQPKTARHHSRVPREPVL